MAILPMTIGKGGGGIPTRIIYGFTIDSNEDDPSLAVTYTDDAVGMTPAHMDYTNDVFDYGTWKNAFFMPRPCMLKSNGTVDYYLDPNDLTKKADGTASDISDTSYDGNAMMQWGDNGKIWWKVTPTGDGTSVKVNIANYQADSDYYDYNFHNSNGASVNYFYTPIYDGSVINNVMRSLSGQQAFKLLQGTTEISYARANNIGTAVLWDIENWCDRQLIDWLLILMGKSLDTQTVYGQGATQSGSEAINDTFRTGIHNTKGLFYGTNSGTVASNSFGNVVKVFGMENYWGFQWRRTQGLIDANGTIKVKLTHGTEDGTTASDYNSDGTGYISTGVTTPATWGKFIDKQKFTSKGMFPNAVSGDSTHYYCDGLWTTNTINAFGIVGGGSGNGAQCGAFAMGVYAVVSYTHWSIGASLSCKPLN